MRNIHLLVAFLLLSATAMAQTISGTISNSEGKPLNGATVSLLRAPDSSVIRLAATKEDGRFAFSDAAAGRYLLRVTHVGQNTFTSTPFDVSTTDITLPAIAMVKASEQMKGVTVEARRPIVEVKADKTILNVEGTINAVGNDALELLRKSPGVTVDKDDNISLSGKNGVQVYIDGRPSPLSGADLANYLKSLQSAQIEAIELITNPSAKYEAAGTAGIINIRLKRNKSFGANGSLNAGWNIGKFARYNGGGSLNYRNKKWNLFSNYNHNHNINYNYFNMFRTTAVDTSFDQQNRMRNRFVGNGFKVGADYFADSRNTFGVMVNGNIGDFDSRNSNHTLITYIPTQTTDRLLIADNRSNGQRRNVNFNGNYRFADTTGHTLNIDGDYGFYYNRTEQLQPNNIYDASGETFKEAEIYQQFTPANIDIYSIKGDYEQNLKGGKLGVGTKLSYVQTDNTFQRFNVTGSNNTEDNHNNFRYRENINALYVNYNKQYKKGIMIQAGLRAENTQSRGHSQGFRYDYGNSKKIGIDSTLDRSYTDFFPSAAITFNKNPMKQWSISYSRRIDRPSYQQLNPFEFNLDKYTFQRGNTELRPQYTNSIGITNTYKYKLTTTLNYSHVADVFAIIPRNEGSRGFIITDNVATQDIVSLNVSMPFQYKWYSLYANLNAYYSRFRGKVDSLNIDVDVPSFTAYTQQSFKLNKKTTAEITGFYSAPSIWQGTIKSKQMWSVDAGLQRTALKGKATVKASVTDIFKTQHWSGTSSITGQYMRTAGGWDSRQFKLNLTYRFGNSQVKAARQRKTGAEDENNRTGGGGGLGGG